MSDFPTYRLSDAHLKVLREQFKPGGSLLAEEGLAWAVEWVKGLPQLDQTLEELAAAFAGVKLGNGIGLCEADGLDYYASEEELASLRQRDERHDWRKISDQDLNELHSSTTFMDAEGFVFHLPAILIADLNDKLTSGPCGFVERLVQTFEPNGGWFQLLSVRQREALGRVLTLVRRHPEHEHHRNEINVLITNLMNENS